MTIAPYRPEPMPLSLSTLDIKDRVLELAEVIANTDFVPRGLRGNPPAILAAILYGHEVGIGPMQSLTNIAVIDGRPTLSVNGMRGLILAAGHELLTEESTVTRAVVAGRRRDSRQTVRKTWTIDDARRAKLAGRTNWTNYPRQMLVARATSELARELFSDVIGGFVAPEELEDMEAVEEPKRKQAEKPGTQRRVRPPIAPVSAPTQATTIPRPPDPPPLPDDPQSTPIREREPGSLSEPPLPDVPRVGDAMRRKMHASFREAGIEERKARLEYIERIVGRSIESSSQLSEAEISGVISALAVEREAANDPGPIDPELEAIPFGEPESPYRPPPASQTQRDRLDELTHELLAAAVITIGDLWRPVAEYRKQPLAALVEELGGMQDGRLQWQPLRESLSVAEASDLITLLEETRRASSLFDIDG